MSYDFHIDSDGALRLIEINTNASLSLLVDELHRFQKIENVFSKEFKSEILATFTQEFNEARAAGSFKSSDRSPHGSTDLKRIGIVDENPTAQRLFIEFAMYQELFATAGWDAKFFDPTELRFVDGQLQAKHHVATDEDDADGPLDLIYNRNTDFYFSAETSRALREAMMAKAAAITPHPYEYRLLGDKDRLLELSDDGFLQSLPLSDEDRAAISRSLIRTIEVKNVEPEWMWKERKGYFFKPRRSHGGKAVYRGSSTSRGTFHSILAGDYLAQEMVPPPVVTFEGEEEMKYDLRFYVYRGKIQLSCSRLYRGQMTNSQSPGGGVAPIRWL